MNTRILEVLQEVMCTCNLSEEQKNALHLSITSLLQLKLENKTLRERNQYLEAQVYGGSTK